MGWRDLLPWSKPKYELTPVATFTDDHAGDRMVLEQLAKAGANMALPREIIHYLYLPTQPDARVAAENLMLCGYTVEIGMHNDPQHPVPRPWLARATIYAAANGASIAEARRIFAELATKLDGDYDGWEAAARP